MKHSVEIVTEDYSYNYRFYFHTADPNLTALALQFTIRLNSQTDATLILYKKKDVLFMFIFITIDAGSTWQVLPGKTVWMLCAARSCSVNRQMKIGVSSNPAECTWTI
jgi:hypothetical protein